MKNNFSDNMEGYTHKHNHMKSYTIFSHCIWRLTNNKSKQIELEDAQRHIFQLEMLWQEHHPQSLVLI